MSYKHNNLLAMRQNWWNDQHSNIVHIEKQFLQHVLTEQGIYSPATLEDAHYLFFSLPSIIIVKGYASGFQHPAVTELMTQYIQLNKTQLMKRETIKIHYHM